MPQDKMWYFVITYFNWFPAFIIWGINRRLKGKVKGLYFIVIGGILQIFAFFLHWSSWNLLKGEPDQLYVWITPLLLAMIAFGLIIAGTLRSFSLVPRGDLEDMNDTNNA
jgi:dolichyl-phosphate-mannose--protein O-mannosyl transferase